jgi:hypothetical protein
MCLEKSYKAGTSCIVTKKGTEQAAVCMCDFKVNEQE